MAWTSPMTFATGAVLTAAQLNTHLRDNLMETAPAKATTAGTHFVASGYNKIAERQIKAQRITATGNTASTDYTDLENVGPQVTVTHGTRCLIFISGDIKNANANASSLMSWEMSGSNEREALDLTAVRMDGLGAANACKYGNIDLHQTLTPGTTTFTAKYRVFSGTGTYLNRYMLVIPF